MKFKKILIIGAIPDEKNKLRYGGATVLMKNFLDFLSEKNISFSFVQNNRYSNLKTGKRRMKANSLYFLVHFFYRIRSADIVMFNFSDHGTVYLLPVLVKIVKLLRKKVVLRKFGGSFDIYFNKMGGFQKQCVIAAMKKVDMMFLETRAGIQFMKSLIGETDKIYWFPNVRRSSEYKKNIASFNRRCVYMSHINTEKGIDDILKVAELLPDKYTIDLYGDIKEDKYIGYNFEQHGVVYYGQIPSDKVREKLIDYDLLLLTSYREGYPGIIIEALSVGVPPITTFAGGIPEIVQDGYNGRLVHPGNITEIKEAILSINKDNYKFYSENALKSFHENFNADLVNEHILNTILTLRR